ncbi:MAG: alpha/beta fold hydrolase [Alphaproteobacteria bacterium]|nr:alpha/beta fold hydrolase [Alphaproteobacteria bacterium]
MNLKKQFSKQIAKNGYLQKDFLEKVGKHFLSGTCKRLSTIPPLNLDRKITSSIDRKIHTLCGNYSFFSPGTLYTTYFDWYVHLMLSPGKQLELLESAWKKSLVLTEYVLSGGDGSKEYVSPLPQDKRFQAPAWRKWPFCAYQQAFLLTEQWWVDATSGVRGVTQHHSDVLPFLTRQFIDVFAPVNVPFMNPLVLQKTYTHRGANFIKGAQNLREDIDRLWRKLPPVGADKFKVGKNLAVTPGKVIYENQLIELIQYSPTTEKVYVEPILIIPAWIMKYYILDLSSENSLVKYLIQKGHTVFMVSWKNPGSKERSMGFDDYLHLGIMNSLDAISTLLPNQKVHAVGYCLGGTLLTIAAAKMGHVNDARFKSITLFAAQVDFEEAGELQFFVDESQLTFLEDIMFEKGYLESNRIAGTFYMLRSNDLIWSRMVENYLMGERQELTDLMAWNADATRLPYKMHSEYLRSLYLNDDLASGRFKVDGKAISLNDINVPVFAVSTQKDHIAPWQSVYKIHLFIGTEITFVLTNGGHNAGIISEPGHPGRHYQISTHKPTDVHLSHDEWQQVMPYHEGSWWPTWQKWLVKHSSGKTQTPAIGNKKQYKPIRNAPGKYVLAS